ncbi:MAG TPA: oxidoreductase [Yinghuangia sp.]|uniref:oxidoreductase n=1 Tax=Yinghuangia sp. YIM S10712 TaxID=3436930 RepID=UPI002CD13071|nr:oxidoreductase [Yinghuangia sp.]
MGTTKRRSWKTTDDIPDLVGTVAVVTGANSGLGFVTARELARKGATVVMACRNAERGEAARTRVAASLPPNLSDVAVLPLDLADLASVRDFADAVGERFDGLDILVNNAGVMALPLRRTADGFEMQMGTNHLGHFALSALLAPLLLTRPGARVVTVASDAHYLGRPDPADLRFRHGRYRKWRAYGASKSANLMFAAELARRARQSGVDLVSVAAHPGYVDTNLQSAGPRMSGNTRAERAMALANRLIAASPDTGALPQLYAATAPDVENGAFYGPRFSMFGPIAHAPRAPWVRDVVKNRMLWTASEEATGIRWAPPLGG